MTEIKKSGGPGNLTLEALLDSPGITPPSPVSESLTNSCPGDNIAESLPIPDTEQNHQQQAALSEDQYTPASDQQSPASTQRTFVERQMLFHQVGMELLTVLKAQDVDGYFRCPLPTLNKSKPINQHISLVEIEHRLLTDRYSGLDEFRTDLSVLFTNVITFYSSPGPNDLVTRLANLAGDWFASLPCDLIELIGQDLSSPLSNEIASEKLWDVSQCDDDSTHSRPAKLNLLNPDTIVSADNCMQSIPTLGQLVGPNWRLERVLVSLIHQLTHQLVLNVGHLRPGAGETLPTGGAYREDRRNRIIPYKYMDYGPYYSFAPSYDSGGSHCTEEANRFCLSTTWLPARSRHLPENGLVEATEGDPDLAALLEFARQDQEAIDRLNTQLDAILPGPEVSPDCVFSACLANALLGNSTDSSFVRKHHEVDLDREDDEEEQINIEKGANQPNESPDGQEDNTQLLTDRIGSDLRALYHEQYRRLGDWWTPNGGQSNVNGLHQLEPTSRELRLAHRVADQLTEAIVKVHPKHLAPDACTLRRLMGIKPDSFHLPSDQSASNGIG